MFFILLVFRFEIAPLCDLNLDGQCNLDDLNSTNGLYSAGDLVTGVDVIVGPTTPTPAFKLGEKVDDPLSMYLGDLFTVSANLSGVPAISIPCGLSAHGLPIGLQLQAPPFQEARLLRAAHMFQQATDGHTKSPAF